MPAFVPFTAIRYADDDLAEVIAPPYDVLSDADVDRLAARSDHNIVHVDVPRGGDDRYVVAAAALTGWLAAQPVPTPSKAADRLPAPMPLPCGGVPSGAAPASAGGPGR